MFYLVGVYNADAGSRQSLDQNVAVLFDHHLFTGLEKVICIIFRLSQPEKTLFANDSGAGLSLYRAVEAAARELEGVGGFFHGLVHGKLLY